jgi:hypothetical protein
MGKGWRPRGPVPADAARQLRTETPRSTAQEKPTFCFGHVDRNANNLWAFNPSGEHMIEIVEFIGQMGQSTWAQIEAMRTGGKDRHRKHHSYNVDSFASAAQADFHKAHLGERFGHDMFRFRLAGEKRLWGFRDHAVFRVVWWDPEHEVCPSEKGHT